MDIRTELEDLGYQLSNVINAIAGLRQAVVQRSNVKIHPSSLTFVENEIERIKNRIEFLNSTIEMDKGA